MPGSITDITDGSSTLKSFPGEDGREWELVTRSIVAALTAHRRIKGAMVIRREQPGAPTEYVIRGGFDHDAAVAAVAEFNDFCDSDVFEKHPCS